MSDKLPWPPRTHGGPQIPAMESTSVALHTPSRGRHVAGSLYAIEDQLEIDAAYQPRVEDIKTVWHGGVLKGWIYSANDGKQYFQPDEQTASRGSISGGAVLGVSLGAVAQPGVRLLKASNVHRDWIVLDGFDHRAKEAIARDGYPYDGATAGGSPIAIGDQIPNGTPHGTTVVDINVARDKNTVVGWMYLGADGNRYLQPYLANLNKAEVQSLQVNAEIVEGTLQLPQYGPIDKWNRISPTPGTVYDKGFEHGECMPGDRTDQNCIALDAQGQSRQITGGRSR